jgi:hypothetical protein
VDKASRAKTAIGQWPRESGSILSAIIEAIARNRYLARDGAGYAHDDGGVDLDRMD